MLLVDFIEMIELRDDLIGFRRRIVTRVRAGVGLNRFEQVFGSAVVQEEDPLPESPERGRPEFVSAGLPLTDVIGQPGAHVMEQQI